MPCYLLHTIEQPDPGAYRDPDLKDVVGSFPQLFCSQCTPPRPLLAGESVKCLDREGPCWKPHGEVCAP
ncbi:MAG: hypothetical protein Q8K99_12960 [Actinomycetota bacterium]|nr:hypothetical protein [Actinomycetota bacterium]